MAKVIQPDSAPQFGFTPLVIGLAVICLGMQIFMDYGPLLLRFAPNGWRWCCRFAYSCLCFASTFELE